MNNNGDCYTPSPFLPLLLPPHKQVVPVADDHLPVILPTDVQFSRHSSSPLAQSEQWCRTSCGK